LKRNKRNGGERVGKMGFGGGLGLLSDRMPGKHGLDVTSDGGFAEVLSSARGVGSSRDGTVALTDSLKFGFCLPPQNPF
jgi:hypothetical protein